MLWARILRLCQGTLKLVTALVLLLWSGFGAYALWDNAQVLAEASDIRADLLQWKPLGAEDSVSAPDNGQAFSALQAINPDVCGWISMEGTGIDFPVLQGKNNLSYISRDVYGNFSLAGSIFLDSRDDAAFAQSYALLYGHHMADGNMFGDLDKYREPEFFAAHPAGQLILPDRVYRLEVAACLVTGASDRRIFDPEYVRDNPRLLEEFLRAEAILCREDLLGEGQYLALTTCATDFTDARTVVIARMRSGEQEE